MVSYSSLHVNISCTHGSHEYNKLTACNEWISLYKKLWTKLCTYKYYNLLMGSWNALNEALAFSWGWMFTLTVSLMTRVLLSVARPSSGWEWTGLEDNRPEHTPTSSLLWAEVRWGNPRQLSSLTSVSYCNTIHSSTWEGSVWQKKSLLHRLLTLIVLLVPTENWWFA